MKIILLSKAIYFCMCRIRRCTSHTPGPIFPFARYLDSWNISVGAETVDFGYISSSAFRRCVVQCWKTAPGGVDIHQPSYPVRVRCSYNLVVRVQVRILSSRAMTNERIILCYKRRFAPRAAYAARYACSGRKISVKRKGGHD